MKIHLWTFFLSISLSSDYILAFSLDLPPNIDYQPVKNLPLLKSPSECKNANYMNENVQSRSSEEEKMLHSATQKPSNEDVIFNIHDRAHYFRNPLAKRAAQGFIGMRGKKDYEKSDYDKRRPTGFQGVRGKKFYLNYPILFTPPKRLPSGFQGMRGKKDFYPNHNITNEESNENGIDYDVSMLLNNQRIRLAFLEFLRQNEINEKIELLSRRNEIDNSLEDYEKLTNFYNGRQFDDLKDKRAPQGFQGVRGKKDVTDVLKKLAIEKRSSVGLFGMRGKKQPSDSHFFGMRGKKVPYDLRSKFVGVRGKKSEME